MAATGTHQSCIQVRHLVQSVMWVLYSMQRYMMLYARTLAAADLVQSGIQSSYYSLRSYILYVRFYMLHVRTSSLRSAY